MLKNLKRFLKSYTPDFLDLACFYLNAVVLIMFMNSVMNDAPLRVIRLHAICLLLNISALIMIKKGEKGKDE